MKKLSLLCTLVFMLLGTTQAQYTKLLDFTGTPNGNFPQGSLISDGTYLYGMTNQGGTNNEGIIIKIRPNGTGYAKLLDFAGASNGRVPKGSLISDGTFLYGMTQSGGTGSCAYGCGTIFKIKHDGTGYAKLLDFAGTSNGSYPRGSLISDGTFLYGMTEKGGSNSFGTIFKIRPDGTGYIKLLDFTGTTNGRNPYGSLIFDGSFLYGMTAQGGTGTCSFGCGTIFKIRPDGTGYSKLLDFTGISNIGFPQGSLISDGTFLFGMTYQGGANDMGVIFKIKPDGNGFSKLFDFNDTLNGSRPFGSLISVGAFLYGMTRLGGTHGLGTIFKIKSDGTGYAKLMDFTGTTNGNGPLGSLISDGTFLYGMTQSGGTNDKGVVFKYALPVGTNELSKNNNKVSVYPNPANDILNIETGNSANTRVQIMSLDGRLVKTHSNINSSKTQINVADLSKGVYFLRIQNGAEVLNAKFVKE